jgi:hypothetical protein
MSKETLDFLANMEAEYKILRPIFSNRERYCLGTHGFELNYAASYWTPPLPPHLAYDLERRQIEAQLQLPAITDHDDIRAPLFLRSVPRAQQIPVSVECTVPYSDSVFHLGVHNSPADTANEWRRTFKNSMPLLPQRVLKLFSLGLTRCRRLLSSSITLSGIFIRLRASPFLHPLAAVPTVSTFGHAPTLSLRSR